MFEFRHRLVRMRLGDSDRALAKAGLIGRPKAKALRTGAEERGWLDPARPLPDDAVLAQAVGTPRAAASAQSCVEPYRDAATDWAEQGIQSKTIYQALVRNHTFGGSYPLDSGLFAPIVQGDIRDAGLLRQPGYWDIMRGHHLLDH